MKTFSIAFLFLIMLVSGCTKDDTLASDYVISLNGQLVIELASNPTTGASWRWTNEKSVSIIEKISWNYVSNDTNGKVGVGGTEIWKFKGVRRGIDTIVLEYSRGLDTDSSPADSKVIVVEVKPL